MTRKEIREIHDGDQMAQLVTASTLYEHYSHLTSATPQELVGFNHNKSTVSRQSNLREVREEILHFFLFCFSSGWPHGLLDSSCRLFTLFFRLIKKFIKETYST